MEEYLIKKLKECGTKFNTSELEIIKLNSKVTTHIYRIGMIDGYSSHLDYTNLNETP